MSRSNQKIWNTASKILAVAVIILALLLVGVRLFGVQVFTVLSGSMEPTYQTGSLIYVKDVDYRGLKEGDVITFMLSEDTVATHRIVEIISDAKDPAVIRYRTKGDANDAEDGALVHYKNILGTPVFTIPVLGYVADFIQHSPGNYLTVALGAAALLTAFLQGNPAAGKPGGTQASGTGREKTSQKGGKYLQK